MLSRSDSGSSIESLKVLQKDITTGDYLVRMTPTEFDKFSSQSRSSVNQCGMYVYML